MFCEKCGTNIPDNVSTCPKCGCNTGVNTEMFCSKCGAKLKEGEEFCSVCGVYTEKKKEEIAEKETSVNALAGLGFVIPILGIILAIGTSKNNPKGAGIILGASIIGFIIEAFVFLPSIIAYMNY